MMIYLDYAASTPVDNEVLDLYVKISKEYYANPNSSHELGVKCNELIKDVSEKIGKYFNVSSDEVIYTSGASECNNLVVKGISERYKARGKHILISSLEHNSIVAAATDMQERGFEVELIPITQDGLIDIIALKKMIRDDTILVSVCSVDSEIGLVQPTYEIGKIVKEYPNCVFHTDATQAIGKVNIDYSLCDLITIAPHKFYGLNGIGLLIRKDGIGLKPLISGGRSTTVYRSGTPDTASIVAAGRAIQIAFDEMDKRYEYVLELCNYLKDKLVKYRNVVINNRDNSVPYTINFSVKGIKAMDIQNKFQEEEIYIATKTSCCPVMTPSKLVYALTRDKNIAASSLRVSLSHLTTMKEIDKFLLVFDKIYKEYYDGEI